MLKGGRARATALFFCMNETKPYPLIVKRVFFEQFARGEKTIEYRRHRGRFTARIFWPGRAITLAYTYDMKGPRLSARVARFEVARLEELGELAVVLRSIYRDLAGGDEIALIHLDVQHSLPSNR